MSEHAAVFTACYRRHHGAVLDFLARYLRDRFAAEDLAQETFLRLVSRNEPLDPDHPTALSYLLTIARHLACDYLRHHAVEKRYQRLKALEEVVLNERFYEDVANIHIEGEVISTMHEVIDDMPPRKRSIVLGKFFQRKKNTQIIQELRTTNFLLQRSLREIFDELRTRLRPYYDPKPDCAS